MSYSRVDKDNSLTVGEVVVEWSSESVLRSSIFETGEERVQFFWHIKSRNFPLNVQTKMSLYNIGKKKLTTNIGNHFIKDSNCNSLQLVYIYSIRRNQEFRLFQILQRTCLKML